MPDLSEPLRETILTLAARRAQNICRRVPPASSTENWREAMDLTREVARGNSGPATSSSLKGRGARPDADWRGPDADPA